MCVKWKWAGQLLSVFAILHLAPLLTSSKELIQPLDCNDIHQQDSSRPSGVYTIYPFGEKSGVEVYCDMDLEGGGWTVLLKRTDGSLNFYRPWNHYKMGFGNANGEYWLGETLFFLRSVVNCAQLYLGAFWYNNCHHSNPTGIYRWGVMATYGASGMEWYPWKGWSYSLKAMSMKFRLVQ
ncbi:ficolin-2-like [Neolamprologus brichardi]|uniref:ficolin-2-like n=1 Tax=Neolamprologus brichardi TaxID=32507 RepID=UPI0003EBDB10|nr:ficolin-2-like [Neolamprologus brichardi]